MVREGMPFRRALWCTGHSERVGGHGRRSQIAAKELLGAVRRGGLHRSLRCAQLGLQGDLRRHEGQRIVTGSSLVQM